MRELSPQTRKLVLLRGLWQFIVLQSVAVPFFHSRGLDNGQVFWVQTVFLGMLCLLDIPSSVLAERWGLRRSLLLGCALKGAGGTLLAASQGPGLVFTSYALIGAGNAFYAGLDYTLIFNALTKSTERETLLKRTQGLLHGMTFGSVTLSGLAGAVLAARLGFEALVLCNAVLAWSSFLLALTVKEDRTAKVSPGLRDSAVVRGAISVLAAPARRAWVLLIVLGTVLPSVFPYLIQLQLTDARMGIVSLGYLFAFQNGMGALIGAWLGKRARHPRLASLAHPLVLLSFWLVSLLLVSRRDAFAFVAAVVVIEIARAVTTVMVYSDFHLSFDGASRPVVGSMLALIGRLCSVMLTGLLGFAGRQFSSLWLCLLIGLIASCGTLGLMARRTTPASPRQRISDAPDSD